MELLERVKDNVIICGLELSFTGDVRPSAIEGWQLFHNCTYTEADFQKTYATGSTIDFDEESVENPAGDSWRQKVTFRFPATDRQRAERIEMLRKVKFLTLKLSNGLDIAIGRNDFFQNTLPKKKFKLNEQTAEIVISALSITPSGYTPNINMYGLPTYVPVTLL